MLYDSARIDNIFTCDTETISQTLTPLLSVAATEDLKEGKKEGGAEPVQSCSLEVRLDPATGSVTATQTKGSTVSSASSAFWGHAQLGFALVAPFVVLALIYYSGYFTEWYADWSATRQHTAWLLDFYQKNAPEVRERAYRIRCAWLSLLILLLNFWFSCPCRS